MTPHHLHAIANLWSLIAAWPNLLSGSHTLREADDADRGTLQAWRPGSGVQGGGQGDQILDAILRTGGRGFDAYEQRMQHTRGTLMWLAERLDLPIPFRLPTDEVLRAFLTAVPTLRPAVALDLAMHIGDEDRRTRTLLGLGHDGVLLEKIRCPHCDTSGSLAIRTSNPTHAQRIVVCSLRTCTRGAIPSIWSRDQIRQLITSPQKAA